MRWYYSIVYILRGCSNLVRYGTRPTFDIRLSICYLVWYVLKYVDGRWDWKPYRKLAIDNSSSFLCCCDRKMLIKRAYVLVFSLSLYSTHAHTHNTTVLKR